MTQAEENDDRVVTDLRLTRVAKTKNNNRILKASLVIVTGWMDGWMDRIQAVDKSKV